MRTVVISSLIALAGVIIWLVGARSLSLLIDGLHRIRLTAEPVHHVRYDNGTVEIAGVRLDTLTTRTLPSGLAAVLDAGGRVAFRYGEKSFPCGPGRSLAAPGELPDVAFTPDPGDVVTFAKEQSHLSWPTPLQMNFMTGSTPSWKRHQYYRLSWVKRGGASLEILWRFEQDYFKEGGWRPQTIQFGSAGLLRASIAEASDLRDAAIRYLTRTRHWKRVEYRLEDRGPAADGSGEIMAAIHRNDENNSQPGSGLSVKLVLDYESHRVTREVRFQ